MWRLYAVLCALYSLGLGPTRARKCSLPGWCCGVNARGAQCNFRNTPCKATQSMGASTGRGDSQRPSPNCQKMHHHRGWCTPLPPACSRQLASKLPPRHRTAWTASAKRRGYPTPRPCRSPPGVHPMPQALQRFGGAPFCHERVCHGACQWRQSAKVRKQAARRRLGRTDPRQRNCSASSAQCLARSSWIWTAPCASAQTACCSSASSHSTTLRFALPGGTRQGTAWQRVAVKQW